MFTRIVLTALLAGAISGVFVWGAHMVKTTPLILAAEVYENAPTTAMADAPGQLQQEAAGQGDEKWAPADGFERSVISLLTDVLTSIGFAFLLIGAITLSGREVDWRRGVVWGLAGFAAFFVSPSLGLAPELPGMQAADLGARQVWWAATAVATITGLALIALQDRTALRWAGAGLIVLPHLVGAPHPEIALGGVPAELASQFAAAPLVVTGLFWMALGGLTGFFYNRFEQS